MSAGGTGAAAATACGCRNASSDPYHVCDAPVCGCACPTVEVNGGCRLGRGGTVVKVVGDDGERAASNPKYTWSQTADEVTFEMPVRSQTERGFVCAVIMRKGGGEVERCAKGRAMK